MKIATARRLLAMSLALMSLASSKSPASAQQILAPDPDTNIVYVLDPTNGNPTGVFALHPLVDDPVNVIDGPNDTLLVSGSQKIHRLTRGGAYLGDYTVDNLNGQQIHGIHRFGSFVGGCASLDEVRVWNSSGHILGPSLRGTADIGRFGNFVLTTHQTDGELYVYQLDGTLIRTLRNLFATHQFAILHGAGTARLAIAGLKQDQSSGDVEPVVYIVHQGGTIDCIEVRGDQARGVIQLESGSLLVSTDDGLFRYALDGTFLSLVLAVNTIQYLDISNNYQP